MQEIDNCPICNTTCELEFGLEEGAGVEIEKDICYATCKTCKTRWRRRDDPKVFGKLIYEKWACRIPEITLSIPFVGGGLKLRPRWCRWIEVKEKQLPVDTLGGMKSEEELARTGKTVEETIAVGRKEYAFYDFKLMRRDKVEGKIISGEPVDAWFLDEENFDKFCRGRYFEPEDVNQSIYEAKIEFRARKKGLWFVVIENSQRASAKVKVNLYSLHKKNRK